VREMKRCVFGWCLAASLSAVLVKAQDLDLLEASGSCVFGDVNFELSTNLTELRTTVTVEHPAASNWVGIGLGQLMMDFAYVIVFDEQEQDLVPRKLSVTGRGNALTDPDLTL